MLGKVGEQVNAEAGIAIEGWNPATPGLATPNYLDRSAFAPDASIWCALNFRFTSSNPGSGSGWGW